MERRGISNEMNNSKFLQVKSQQCFPKMAFSFIGFFPLEAKGKKLGGKLTQSLDKNLRENWDGCKAQPTAAETADFLSSSSSSNVTVYTYICSMQQNWASKVESSAPFTKLGEKKKKLRKWQWNIERSMYVVSFSIAGGGGGKKDFLCQEQWSWEKVFALQKPFVLKRRRMMKVVEWRWLSLTWCL